MAEAAAAEKAKVEEKAADEKARLEADAAARKQKAEQQETSNMTQSLAALNLTLNLIYVAATPSTRDHAAATPSTRSHERRRVACESRVDGVVTVSTTTQVHHAPPEDEDGYL